MVKALAVLVGTPALLKRKNAKGVHPLALAAAAGHIEMMEVALHPLMTLLAVPHCWLGRAIPALLRACTHYFPVERPVSDPFSQVLLTVGDASYLSPRSHCRRCIIPLSSFLPGPSPRGRFAR